MRCHHAFDAVLGACVALAVAACGGDDGTQGATDEADTISADTETAAPDTSVGDVADGVGGADAPDAGGCAEGTTCDDGDPCTVDDQCDADGACAGAPKDCDDGLACTTDACGDDGACEHTLIAGFCTSTLGERSACVAGGELDPLSACRECDASGDAPAWEPLDDGASCEDADACTLAGTCEAGACVADETLDCETDDPCLAGSCDPQLGCVTTPTTAPCDDGDVCTVGDACAGGECVAGGEAFECDDGDACTVDSCESGVGCVYDAEALCDDGDPCTDDSCLEGGNCVNEPFTGPCEDGDPCTEGETCDVAGVCAGGDPTDCDDGNACTLDSCHPELGCLNVFLEGACDDGDACTVDDACVAGECFGAKTNTCEICELEGTEHANRITSLRIAGDGNPGSGLDVDGDPETCSPESDCGGGVDNALALVAALVNDGIQGSIENGVVNWVVDLRDVRFDGETFPMPIYDSGMDDADVFAGCDRQVDVCRYDVAQLSFDQSCAPYFMFDNARVVDGEIVAGGTDQLISMVLPLEGGELLAVTIAWARVRASFTMSDGQIASMNGIISGAIPKQQLIDAIEGLDEESLPISTDLAVELLETLVANDIDLDGDGIKESVSVGMRYSTTGAIILQEP